NNVFEELSLVFLNMRFINKFNEYLLTNVKTPPNESLLNVQSFLGYFT
ncbi:MAG: hypothetical protein ACI83H_002044, partial [Glaciecola sp.]